MFGSKVFATLTSSVLITINKQQKTLKAECEGGKTAAEQGAADLDKIFGAASEGGIPPDPEEI